ncbi:hypothetical protein CFC21_095710 [Triticum aestivum]|uniref:Uncharacterized protein n=2 Tax=Triticum aestivum TaxID=4565 RepID=A0A3B6R8S1_WHEAT|nr:uncharacterized protein LOC123150198 isoform X2 [Triticum aestivum]KAF7093290.1 hypothetical protein CFC21_095710 [Triticum aestivum]
MQTSETRRMFVMCDTRFSTQFLRLPPPSNCQGLGQLHALRKLPQQNLLVLVTDEITMIMKQQNASSIRRLTEASNAIQVVLSQAKNALQSDMLNYSERILKSISDRCLCCRTRGFAECHASGVTTAKNVRFSTPVAQRIQGHRLDLSDGEAMSPLIQGGSSRKRNASNEDSASASKKSISESSIVINYFKDTVRKVAQMYADLPANTTVTVFGQTQGKLSKRKYIFQHGFATNPWECGVLPLPPHAETIDMIVAHFSNLTDSDLQRHYVIHHSPRLVRVTGFAMFHQLIGSRSLDHELASIICRRYTQSNMEANRECPYLNWRHNMEPEFATIVLSDHDYVNNISI